MSQGPGSRREPRKPALIPIVPHAVGDGRARQCGAGKADAGSGRDIGPALSRSRLAILPLGDPRLRAEALLAAESLGLLGPCGLPLAHCCRRLWRLGYRRGFRWLGISRGAATVAASVFAERLVPWPSASVRCCSARWSGALGSGSRVMGEGCGPRAGCAAGRFCLKGVLVH